MASSSPDNGSLEEVRFQLVLPSDLVRDLESIPDLTIESSEVTPDRVQHELSFDPATVIAGAQIVATVLTIVVKTDKVIPICRSISEKIHQYFSRPGHAHPEVKVVGEKEETTIEIRLSGVEKTANTIRIIITG